jgi:uncharacterized protein YjbI with pentapeptide repeats/Ca2+-binding RTX toxin-like protein
LELDSDLGVHGLNNHPNFITAPELDNSTSDQISISWEMSSFDGDDFGSIQQSLSFDIESSFSTHDMTLQEFEDQILTDQIEEPVIGPTIIPFSSSENATIISLSADDIPGVSEGTFHLYHDGWNKSLHNYELGPPTEASTLFIQAVEIDTSNEGSDTTDYKATEAFPIELSPDQIAALKAANGSEADNNLILTNMHMNMQSVPDVMREPEVLYSSSENQTTTYVVTVDSGTNDYGSGNKYYIDGVLSPPLNLVSGKTYEFDLSAVPSSHPFHLSTSPNGTWGDGSIYEQVTRTEDKLTVTINDDTLDLYYFCERHSGMGSNPNIDQITEGDTATTIDEIILGTFDNDMLSTGNGSDEVYGYTGDDTITVDGLGDKIINGGEGTDTVNLTVITDLSEVAEFIVSDGRDDTENYFSITLLDGSLITMSNIEEFRVSGVDYGVYDYQGDEIGLENTNLIRGAFFDTSTGTTYLAKTESITEDVGDIFTNYDGSRMLYSVVDSVDVTSVIGTELADQLGRSGDTWNGSVVNLGDGDDSTYGFILTDNANISFEEGNDTLSLAMSHSALNSLNAFKLDGGIGSDTLNFNDSDLPNGYTLNLTIGGATNFENIIGSNSDEIIIGNSKSNELNGFGGSDTLDGGSGTDIITTGSGSDTIVIRPEDGVSSLEITDRITDFEDGYDIIGMVGLNYSEFIIQQGTENFVSHTILSISEKYVAILENTIASNINIADFMAMPTSYIGDPSDAYDVNDDHSDTITFTATVDKWQSDGLGAGMDASSMKLHRKDVEDLPLVTSREVNGIMVAPGTNLMGISLEGADLSGMDLSYIDFSGINLKGANLSGSNLHDAKMDEYTDLTGADLSNINFYGDNTVNGYSGYSYANLNSAIFSNVKDLSGADFTGVFLFATKFQNMDLSGVNFKDANLERASFEGSTLDGADLGGANIESTWFFGATMVGTNLLNAHYANHNPPDYIVASASDINFYGMDAAAMSQIVFEPDFSPQAPYVEDEVGIDLVSKGNGEIGHKHKPDMDKGEYELRVEHTQETDGAIDIEDVMGVLSLARGRSTVSGKEHELAADWNGDGLIDIEDVMGVLSRARGRSKDDEWRFHEKTTDTSLWDNDSKTNKLDITLDGDEEIDLSAILRGDVNGSYNAAVHNRAAPASAPEPNYAPLPMNNDDELLAINLDIV